MGAAWERYGGLVAAGLALAALVAVPAGEDPTLKLGLLTACSAAAFLYWALTGRAALVAFAALGQMLCHVLPRWAPAFCAEWTWVRSAPRLAELDCFALSTALTVALTAARPPASVAERRAPELSPIWLGVAAAWIALEPISANLPSGLGGPYVVLLPWAIAVLYATDCPRAPRARLALQWLAPISIATNFLRTQALTVGVHFSVLWIALWFARPSWRAACRVATALTALFLLQGVKYEARRIRWAGTAWNDRVSDTAKLLGEGRFLEDPGLKTLQRFFDPSLEAVLASAGSPRWEGKSYRDLVLLFIPRVLWKDKPSHGRWHEFGLRYGLLKPDDRATSIHFNHWAEGFANFGWAGLTAAAVGFAALLAALAGFADRSPNLFYFVLLAVPVFRPTDSYSLAAQLWPVAVFLSFSAPIHYWRKLNSAHT